MVVAVVVVVVVVALFSALYEDFHICGVSLVTHELLVKQQGLLSYPACRLH